jgi:predicted aldo/keto reductase-like oxidoreductase
MALPSIRLGRTGYQVSRISFGALPIQKLSLDDATSLLREALQRGVTYIDSAIGYGDSEEKIGRALQGLDRDGVIFATKSMARDAAGIQEHVALSRRRMGVERIHNYQLHAINDYQLLEQVLAPGGALEGLQRARDRGEIAHISITGHRPDVLVDALKTGEFATVQAPYNFIELAAADELFPVARQLDVGIIIMKPLGGGMLAKARLAIGYILQQLQDALQIPGFETLAELDEIIAIDAAATPLSATELAEIDEIKAELGTAFCRRCNYCGPCPQEIYIPTGMIMHTLLKRAGTNFFVDSWGKDLLPKVATCRECGVCEPRCPYELPIRQILKRNVRLVQDALIEREGKYDR